MAALTAGTPIIRENIGSLTLLIIPLTTSSTSDTYLIGTGLPIVALDVWGNSSSAGTSFEGDATYSSTTGNVTIVSANQGSINLVVLMRT